MPALADYVLDSALSKLDTEANVLHLCSADPGVNYTQATSTYTLGNKTGLSVGAPADATPNGRKVTIAAITDGTVTASGNATHWAIVDTANTRVLASNALSASKAVVTGNPFTVDAFDITLPDAVSV